MNSQQRVLAACGFTRPDRIPRFDSFWEYPNTWRESIGPPENLTDVAIWYPDETPYPSHAGRSWTEGGWIYETDGWGRTIRRREGAYFVQTLAVPLGEGSDVDRATFESPRLDTRYLHGVPSQADLAKTLREAKARHCVFGKTGGPFLRTTFVRGESQFLTDIAADPGLARALADKMGDHLTAVGVEQIERWGLQETGIWIYDDMAYNHGPMFSPASFERVFLPAYRRMLRAYKAAGARYVFLHSDGDVRPVLDMLIDAGIQGLNPLERRANMDIVAIRKRYPKLILAGGMCNTDTLVHGPIAKIQTEARQIIDLGRDGGVIIGTHSVSPEIPLAHFQAYAHICDTYGDFSASAEAAVPLRA